MRVSEVKDLRDMVGKKVRLREDSKGVPAGTVGKVVSYGYHAPPPSRDFDSEWITIDWVDRKEKPIFHIVERSVGDDRTRLLEMI